MLERKREVFMLVTQLTVDKGAHKVPTGLARTNKVPTGLATTGGWIDGWLTAPCFSISLSQCRNVYLA